MNKGWLIGIPVLAIIIYGFWWGATTEFRHVPYPGPRYEIYHVTAPFGVLYSNEHGTFLASTTEASEAVLVKYYDGSELKAIKDIDITKDSYRRGEDIRILVDGEFYLEREMIYQESYRNGKMIDSEYDYLGDWVLHLPALPMPDYNRTTDYIRVK